MVSKRNLAVLVGNGLSIAFNQELALASITKTLIEQLEAGAHNGDKIVHAMNRIAARSMPEGEPTDEDFEKLVGAFDSQALTLEELSHLAELVESDEQHLLDAIKEVATFSERIRDMGVSYVLETIMKRSYGDHLEHASIYAELAEIIERFDGRIYFGNLNYDTLLMSALKAIEAPMCDMASGYDRMRVEILDDDAGPQAIPSPHSAYKLRRSLDFPPGENSRVRLVHLHGSLVFWRDTQHDLHVKLPIDALRQHALWKEMREGKPSWRPSVVLANSRDKGHHVKQFPFDLAYEAFRAGLRDAEHWLLVGYSFRDQSVNRDLREEFLKRGRKPQVLVSTFGDDLSAEDVELALGWGAEDEASNSWLSIDREGVEGLVGRPKWGWFSYTSAPHPA